MGARLGCALDAHRLIALWSAAASVAGQLLDLRWHLAHDEFETASDPLQAHWLRIGGESDPELAHLLIAAAKIAAVAAAIAATVSEPRRSSAPA